jgi:hypothetical protein
MNETPRALRRAHARRMKAKARRVMRLWFRQRFTDDPRQVGINASTHCRPCGCWMCQEDGREVPQRRERSFYDQAFD